MSRRRPLGNAALAKIHAIRAATHAGLALTDQARAHVQHQHTALVTTQLADIARLFEQIARYALEIRHGVDELEE